MCAGDARAAALAQGQDAGGRRSSAHSQDCKWHRQRSCQWSCQRPHEWLQPLKHPPGLALLSSNGIGCALRLSMLYLFVAHDIVCMPYAMPIFMLGSCVDRLPLMCKYNTDCLVSAPGCLYARHSSRHVSSRVFRVFFPRATMKGTQSAGWERVSASHRYSPAPPSDFPDILVAGNALLKSHSCGIIAFTVSIVILVPGVHSRAR